MRDNKSRSLEYLKADIYRCAGVSSWKAVMKNAIGNRTFRPIFTLRMCQHYKEKGTILSKPFFILFRLLHKRACQKAAIDLSWKTNIGPGFCITHGWGLVVSPGAQIGSNVTVFHGVTIGSKHKILENGERNIGYPMIKDNVWIGANSVIVGNVTIGEGSIVAPLSMITKEVAPHTAVGCNPQRVLKENVKEDVVNKVVWNEK